MFERITLLYIEGVGVVVIICKSYDKILILCYT